MISDWGVVEKGGSVVVMRREDALDAGLPGPLSEELVLVYSHEEQERQAIQCSRAYLAEVLRGLAPAEVRIFRSDAQLEAAVRQGTGVTLH